jgi:hypothetical protein
MSKLTSWLPSRGNVLFTTIAIGVLVIANRAGALSLATPNAPTLSTNTIPYQGRIANSAGTPLTGNYEITFAFYNQLSGGSALWSEAWTGGNSVRISDGLFNVLLGSLQPIPQNIITGNNNLWLGVKVGSDAEMVPRVQLGSVPFATQALTVPDGSITQAKLAAGVLTRLVMLDNPVLEINGESNGFNWTLLDLSNSVPSTARSVLLHIYVNRGSSGTTPGRLDVRTIGATLPSLTAQGDWGFNQGFVKLVNRRVEISFQGQNAWRSIAVVGYAE